MFERNNTTICRVIEMGNHFIRRCNLSLLSLLVFINKTNLVWFKKNFQLMILFPGFVVFPVRLFDWKRISLSLFLFSCRHTRRFPAGKNKNLLWHTKVVHHHGSRIIWPESPVNNRATGWLPFLSLHLPRSRHAVEKRQRKSTVSVRQVRVGTHTPVGASRPLAVDVSCPCSSHISF